MGYRPVSTLRGRKYVSLSEASAMVGGLVSPGTIRDLVVRGQIAGAVRAGRRYYIPRVGVPDLIVDMSAGDQHAPTALDTKRAG